MSSSSDKEQPDTVGDIIAPREESSSEVTTKEKVSRLWDSLRISVKNTTHEIKTSLVKPGDFGIVYYSKPICLAGKNCKQADSRDHMRSFRHLCPYQHQCNSQVYPTHINDFVHSSLSAEAANLVDPNDNKAKSQKSGGSSLDFLDDNSTIGGAMNNANNNYGCHTTIYPTQDLKANALTSNFKRNAPVQKLVPIRCSYGEEEWNIWYYSQTAQWPLPGEILTEEDEVILNYSSSRKNDDDDNNNQSQFGDNKNGGEANNASMTDKAKDFFDNLFSSVKGKKSDNVNREEKMNQEEVPAGAQRLSNDENEGSSLLGGNDEDEEEN